MEKKLLLFTFILSASTLIGQTINRMDIKGIILADENDVEGITIFNTSANQGTITDFKGEFSIEVTLNDRIEVSALQFQSISIIIDEDVIKSQFLKIHLVEQVNQLDAVVLSFGLSGNLITDIKEVKTIRPITIEMGNMNAAFEYNDDMAFDNNVIEQSLKSNTNKGEFYNGVNFGEIIKLFSKSKKRKPKAIEQVDANQPIKILAFYSKEFISTSFNIPTQNIDAFIAFINEKEIDSKLLESKNEILLIEFLIVQNELFLKEQRAKN